MRIVPALQKLLQLTFFGLLGLGWTMSRPAALSAEDAPAAENAGPIGQFVTVESPVDDMVLGKVSRTALALQARAQQENRKGILVLEVTAGSSQFHQVQGLAKFLLNDVPGLTTVAWIPNTVRGNNVVVALACQEIVMHPTAELGDLGMGKPLDENDRAFVVNLANRRHNKRLSEPLVLGMMDPQLELIWIQLESGIKPQTVTESRLVLPAEFDRLLRSKAVILKHETIKPAGTDGVFSGEKARAFDILTVHTAATRNDLAGLYQLPREAMRENPGSGTAPQAMVIHINTQIDELSEQFVTRQILRAKAAGFNLLIFEIHSPGGLLMSSQNLANTIADLEENKIRTVAYIPKHAISGAAMIALGCDEIYLQPQALIGDAGPIESRDGQPFQFVPEKQLSVVKQIMGNLAEKKHRSVAIAQAMSDKNLEVFEAKNRETGRVAYMTEAEIRSANEAWIQGPAIPDAGSGEFLTVNGRRAFELGLAESPVTDFSELKLRLGIPRETQVPVAAQTWVDELIYYLNDTSVTMLLLIVGILCIYLELHFPSGMFGICSALCFSLFFWSRCLDGTAGYLEIVLFLLGIGLLALEIFVLPGFGIFGVSGGLLLIFSLILASQTFIIPVTQNDFKTLSHSVGTLGGALGGVMILGWLMSRYLPAMPFFKAMILSPPGTVAAGSDTPRLAPWLTGGMAGANSVLERDSSLVGRQGVAQSLLRPSGKALLGEDLVDVISEGPYIARGTPIEVIGVEGNRVIVRELLDPPQAPVG